MGSFEALDHLVEHLREDRRHDRHAQRGHLLRGGRQKACGEGGRGGAGDQLAAGDGHDASPWLGTGII